MSKSQFIRLASLLLVLCGFVMTPANCAADKRVHAFFVGKLWPGDGEPIADAVMLVVDGRITSVGAAADIDIPPKAKRHQLDDAVVVPGFVIAETSIGIASDDERTLTPEVRAIDGFDLFADYSNYVAAGVTTVQISPGQQRLMPGQGAVVKLAGDDHSRRILSREESLRLVLSRESASAPRIYEPPVGAVSVDNPLDPTRPQIAQSLAERVAGLRAIFAAAQAGETDADGILDFEALRENLAAGRIRVKARTAAEIRAAISLFAEIQSRVDKKLQLILTNPVELDSFVDDAQQLKSFGIVLNAGISPGRVFNPSIPDKNDPPKTDVWEYAAALFAAGVGDSVAVHPASDSDLDDILFLAGLFTRSGNSPVNALKMLTANPAKILGVDKHVGVLAAGRDADFVVLSGDPFQGGTLVQATWINGQKMFDRDAADRATLIQADMVYASAGQTVADGTVLVSGTTIQAIGSSVSIPADVSIRRFPGAVVVPGFVDMGTGLGFGGSISSLKLTDTLGDRLASDDPTIDYARQGGVTTAVFATSGSPSPLLAFKLGDTPRLLKEPVAIKFSMPANLTSGLPALKLSLTSAKAYADSWTRYEAELDSYKIKLKAYEVESTKYEAAKKIAEAKKAAEEKKAADTQKTSATPTKETEKPADDKKPATDDKKTSKADAKSDDTADKSKAVEGKPAETKTPAATEAKPDPNAPVKPSEPTKPKASSTYEPYRALMAGTIPAVVEAKSVNAIEAAVKLFREEFKLKMILIGADDAYRSAELLAKHDVSVSIGPTLVSRVENKLINMPQVLSNHQVAFAFQSNATSGVRQLPMAVQYAVFRGLGSADALNGLTHSAAKLLSLDDSIGSLAPGKDADLVVMSGPPFEPSSEVLAVMIDGVWVYERGEKP